MILEQFWQFLTCYTTSGYIEHTPQFPYQVPAHLRGGWFQIITPLAAIAHRQALLLHHFFNSLHSFGTYVFTQTYFLMRCWIQYDADANSCMCEQVFTCNVKRLQSGWRHHVVGRSVTSDIGNHLGGPVRLDCSRYWAPADPPPSKRLQSKHFSQECTTK